MPRKLTDRERRLLRYHGMPAADVARVEHLTVEQVMEIRATLSRRGVTPAPPGAEPDGTQLTMGDVEQLMRDNRAPRAADQELGWTTSSDPHGW